MLSLESPGARMSNLARQEIYFGRFFSVEELHASIEAVTAEDVQQTASEFFEPRKIAATVVGPLEGFHLTTRPAGLLIFPITKLLEFD